MLAGQGVGRRKLVGGGHLLVRQGRVGGGVLGGVRRRVDSAGVAECVNLYSRDGREEVLDESRTYFMAVLKRPLRVSIVHVHWDTTSVNSDISAAGRSLTSHVQASTPAPTERVENARIGIETR